MDKDEKEFWLLGKDAVKKGLITMKELMTIARVGHRKQRYWARHLRDLKELIEMRNERSNNQE